MDHLNGVWHIFRFECLLPFRNLPFSSQQLFLLWFLLLNPQSNDTASFHCTLCPASHVSWGVVTWGKMTVKCGIHLVFSHLNDINPLVSTCFCLLSYTFKHLFIFNLMFISVVNRRFIIQSINLNFHIFHLHTHSIIFFHEYNVIPETLTDAINEIFPVLLKMAYLFSFWKKRKVYNKWSLLLTTLINIKLNINKCLKV